MGSGFGQFCVVRREDFAQFAEGVLHPGQGGVDGDFLKFGDFFEGQIGLHAHEKDFALFGGEFCHSRADALAEFAVAEVLIGSGEGRSDEGGECGGFLLSAAHGLLEAGIRFSFTGEIDNPVAGDSEEPRAQFIAFVTVQVAEGAEPDILKDVFGGMHIVDHPVNKAEQGLAGVVHNFTEGVDIALAPCVQKVFKISVLHHGFGYTLSKNDDGILLLSGECFLFFKYTKEYTSGMLVIMKTKSMHDVLGEVFGFPGFRPGQERVVERILAGESALAVFPTGGGKSLCYQLPALMLEGMTLVVSPLIALMKDQIDFLVGKGIRAARMDSSLTAEESRQVWDDLWNGNLKLLYVAPERFASERFLQRLRRTRLSLMVIDEAHCISEWGHNFRPDYMKMARLAKDLAVERVLALTATATPAVAADICESFDIGPDAYVNTGFHRPNLEMFATPCEPEARDNLLVQRLRERPRGASIVYVTLQRTAEEVAARLTAAGLPAVAYHAGLGAEVRHQVQDAFMQSADAIVVATIAFGMGIDKADIRHVIHYNPPKSLENYMQETGRAGRDGQTAYCEMLLCPDDVATLENFSYGDTPAEESVRGVVTEILGQPDTFDVSVYDLSARHDIRQLVMSTLLTYLELDGVLESLGPHYNEYKFQPQRSSGEMLAAFDEERAAFLRRLFAQATKGRTWLTVDLSDAAAALGEDRKRLVAAFNYLEEKGELTLKVSGLRHGYRFLKRPEDVAGLVKVLHGRFRDSEKRDLERIRQVVDLAGTQDCTVRKVLGYFGEVLEKDCGHCDRCRGLEIPPMPPEGTDALTPAELAQLDALKQAGHEALATPRQLARFLCGLASPAASRARLTRDPQFGSMAHHRFATVALAAKA